MFVAQLVNLNTSAVKFSDKYHIIHEYTKIRYRRSFRNNRIRCLKAQVLILCVKTMRVAIARVRSEVPQEPTSGHAEEAGDGDSPRFRRAGRKRPKLRATLAEPSLSQAVDFDMAA